MVSVDLIISRYRQFLTCQGEMPKRKAALQDIGLSGLPGFVNPHNHLPFAGSREGEFFDIFCKEGIYYIAELRSLRAAAQQAGWMVKIHVGKFIPMGGAQLAVESGVISAKHLVAITDDGIRRMAEIDTAAILLPGVPFFLMQEHGSPGAKTYRCWGCRGTIH